MCGPSASSRLMSKISRSYVSANAQRYGQRVRGLCSPQRFFSKRATRKTDDASQSGRSLGRLGRMSPSYLFQQRPLLIDFLCHGLPKRALSRGYFSLSKSPYTPTPSKFSSLPRRSLRWTPVPILVGVLFALYRQFAVLTGRKTETVDGVEKPKLASQRSSSPSRRNKISWHVPAVFYVYQFLPLRALSRSWGWLNDLYLPHWLREPVLSAYTYVFGVNLAEAAIPDLKWYKNLGEFFRRRLRPGVRPIDSNSALVSPADGVVLHFGRVEDDCVEQVKGMTFSLAAFLGPKTWHDHTVDDELIVEEAEIEEPKTYRKNLAMQRSDSELYHCVIYLAPGDYHRFHSPTDWNILFRRHFPGHLYSVSPVVTRRIEDLFNYNERVVYYGQWQHGFFSMSAVGATNVGSIHVYFDERLKTNNRRYKIGNYLDWNFAQHTAPSAPQRAIALEKGDEFGEFNLGSTIVLLFEAPKNFKFTVEVGEKILYGRPLGNLQETS
ncbi:hypothetical protein RvY_14131 [Ramazzottius varieornatus]|uniref:Phosphatidylserine decarboxylase proenzyme, mitochondrial n=1 Tax=Ramazzottius varieornatus TaxID=947166 RepID=A0A1D1VVD7_RAMVA|nr:hypothetical protein RvY_14131 [Ramazzottius varieornatus]